MGSLCCVKSHNLDIDEDEDTQAQPILKESILHKTKSVLKEYDELNPHNTVFSF